MGKLDIQNNQKRQKKDRGYKEISKKIFLRYSNH